MKNNDAKSSAIGSAGTSARDKLLASAATLSRQQQVIADFLLNHLQEIPFLSVMEVAERTGTSEATVVRLSQRIGYDGYAQLKMALVEMLRDDISDGAAPSRGHADLDLGKDVLAAMSRLEIQNIERTLQRIDRRDFDAAAAILADADHVFTFGLGISAHLAELASYLFTEHGVRSTALDARFTSPREQLVVLRPGDVVLGMSFPPYSQETIEVLQEARARELQTVVITDRATAPAAAFASAPLLVACDGMTFTNTTASVDVVLNALAVKVASAQQDQSMEVIGRINEILAEEGMRGSRD